MNVSLHKQVCVFAACVLLAGTAMCAAAATPGAPGAAEVERGHYLAIAGDCVSCHTAPGGKPYAGGLPTMTPIGAVISTNITPSKTDGIGNYTLQQFSAAVREGIRADGAHLYPVMPYTEYSQLTNSDVQALYAYFMHGVQPVDSKPPKTRLPFPFNIRMEMAVWNWMFLDKHPFTADPAESPAWNRGAYLVRGPTHCGTCHTPRNLMMAEKSSDALAGGQVDTWFAPNITSDANSGIGNWSEQDIVDYLHSGRAPGKAQEAAGPMAEAIQFSLSHLTQADLQAIAVYLKTVPARHDPADTRPVDTWGSAYADLASIRGKPLPKHPDDMSGPQLYDAYCASCHEDQGQGSFDGGLPSLFHNTATGRSNTANLVMVMLDGIHGYGNGAIRMPGFGSELSNRQIATLGSYVTQHFGNPAATITVSQVATLRAGGASSNLVLLARILIVIALIILALIIVGIVVLIRRRTQRRTLPATP
ncbi:MAG TPA: cytochrome c [Rhodanobacteraceae bacterium]